MLKSTKPLPIIFKDRKTADFTHPPCLKPPLGVTPLKFSDEIWNQKARIVGLADTEEIMTLAFFVLSQYRLLTDGRTDTLLSQRPALA